MVNEQFIAETANRLEIAERTGVQIRQLTLDHPEMTVDDAYAIQSAWIAKKIADGRTISGRKIGLTSKAMQYASNIDEPDYGVLLDDMFFRDGTDIPMRRFIVPRIEVELAFVLRSPLRGPNCDMFSVLRATEYVVPALEIIDARIQQVDPGSGRTRKVLDTISDNAAGAGVILGGCAMRPDRLDLRTVAAVCYKNGAAEESGVAAAVLNHPANGVSWLANKLHRFGAELASGDIVLAGSFTRPVRVGAGDTFQVDYGLFGAVCCHFV